MRAVVEFFVGQIGFLARQGRVLHAQAYGFGACMRQGFVAIAYQTRF